MVSVLAYESLSLILKKGTTPSNLCGTTFVALVTFQNSMHRPSPLLSKIIELVSFSSR